MESQAVLKKDDLEFHTQFVEKDGLRYAGTHLLVDFWDAHRLDDLAHMKAALTQAAECVGATVLDVDLHYFPPQGGVSGIAVLAESHISVPTWPEESYAALDIFVCGDCDAYKALPALRRALRPGRVKLSKHRRGIKS